MAFHAAVDEGDAVGLAIARMYEMGERLLEIPLTAITEPGPIDVDNLPFEAKRGERHKES